MQKRITEINSGAGKRYRHCWIITLETRGDTFPRRAKGNLRDGSEEY
jgi:hypothetical protein